MPYAVMQTALEVPTIAQLKQALRAVPGLTQLDAYTLGQDAYGILVKGVALETAQAMQRGLQAQGVSTEVIDDRALPALPPTKFVHQLACLEAGLQIYDPAGRAFIVNWGHLLLVAAGSVRLSEFVRRAVHRPQPLLHDAYGLPGNQDDAPTEYDTREERHAHLLLEIVLTRAVLRYSIVADRFNFAYLGERRLASRAQNFVLLIQDLLRFAPHAVVNRGARQIRDNAVEVSPYPSKNAFYEEITWLLWRQQPPPPPSG